ncbi:class I SAM-dependent methyltransferase [Candidatus Pacearchaeota archaeon]|nr:class I SAM-dependent methyltransferase [Candidatus Pacearchaeota archaeon]
MGLEETYLKQYEHYKRIYSIKEIESLDGSKSFEDMNIDDKEIIELETDNMQNFTVESQKGFVEQRIWAIEGLRKIVEKTFNEFVEKNASCAEFGSGAFGTLYNFLLPKQFKKNWKQFDINPEFVEHNKKFTNRYNKKAKIKEGDMYNMPLGDSSVDVICGLSSWDSIWGYQKTINEVKRCLVPGGIFIHLQDLLPAEAPLLLTEAKKRQDRGISPDFLCGFHKEKRNYFPGFYGTEDWLITMASIEKQDKLLRLGKYLTNHLEDIFKQNEFRILRSSEETYNTVIKRKTHMKELRNLGFCYDGPENVFLRAYGHNDCWNSNDLDKKSIRLISSMDVLVAQKQNN